jgi:hypothetical protein
MSKEQRRQCDVLLPCSCMKVTFECIRTILLIQFSKIIYDYYIWFLTTLIVDEKESTRIPNLVNKLSFTVLWLVVSIPTICIF